MKKLADELSDEKLKHDGTKEELSKIIAEFEIAKKVILCLVFSSNSEIVSLY